MRTKLTFGNDRVKLQFDPVKGYLEGFTYQGMFTALHSKLWQVEAGNAMLDIGGMQRFSGEVLDNVLHLVWENEAARVAVTLRAEEDKLYWNLQTELSQASVGKVEFPIFEGLRFTTDNELIVTWQNGRILKNPVENFSILPSMHLRNSVTTLQRKTRMPILSPIPISTMPLAMQWTFSSPTTRRIWARSQATKCPMTL